MEQFISVCKAAGLICSIPRMTNDVSISIDQLQRAVRINSTIFPASIYAHPLSPKDMTVFTLWSGEGLFREHDDIQPVIPFLHDLYDVMTTKGSRQGTSHDSQAIPQSTESTLHVELLPPSSRVWHDGSCLYIDPRIPVLQHTIQLAHWFFSGLRAPTDALRTLQGLLQSTELDNFWGSLPGALVWCLAIGTRLSPPGPLRKWFMMKLTRSTCALAMGLFDEVLRSVRTVLDALDRAEESWLPFLHSTPST